MIEEFPIFLGGEKAVMPVSTGDPTRIGEMKLSVAFIALPPLIKPCAEPG